MLRNQTGRTKASVEATLNAVITATLAKGGKVALVGLGTFSTSKRATRTGRNPATDAAIKIAATKIAKFSAGAGLRRRSTRNNRAPAAAGCTRW